MKTKNCSQHEKGCPILSRSLRQGGKAQTSTRFVILSGARSAQSKDLHFAKVAAIFVSCVLLSFSSNSRAQDAAHPGARTVMDAHNCYPYYEWWADRIDRALSAGTPLAIEQDLAWHTDPKTGKSWSIVTHSAPGYGNEPTMKQYFFERVRPIVEQALRDGNHSNWPLITLNLDFKSEEPEHLRAVFALLKEYQDWLTTAPRTADAATLQPLEVRPILVLTGESDAQEKVFYDEVPVGSKLLVFGAAHTTAEKNEMASPEVLEPARATNYRRWWNNPWGAVEKGGQNKAGEWTKEDNLRLRALVEHAHQNGLWIRFYTLDGVDNKQDLSCHGWFSSYNFGSYTAAEARWRAALEAGVDYIASDQYEALGKFIQENSKPH
jgi:glycerophosphoryl diester phosphodiesterase